MLMKIVIAVTLITSCAIAIYAFVEYCKVFCVSDEDEDNCGEW